MVLAGTFGGQYAVETFNSIGLDSKETFDFGSTPPSPKNLQLDFELNPDGTQNGVVTWNAPGGLEGASYTYNLRVATGGTGGEIVWNASGPITLANGGLLVPGRGAISGTQWMLDKTPIGTRYTVSVQAVDSQGRGSAWSDPITATPDNNLLVNVFDANGPSADVDDGDINNDQLTLREALNYINSIAPPDDGAPAPRFNIGFSTGGTITTTEPLEIRRGVDIHGGVTIKGSGQDRLFTIDDLDPSASINVSLFGLQLVGGRADLGGSIYSTENLSLDDVVISDSQATLDGGAIYAEVPAGGKVKFVDRPQFRNQRHRRPRWGCDLHQESRRNS